MLLKYLKLKPITSPKIRKDFPSHSHISFHHSHLRKACIRFATELTRLHGKTLISVRKVTAYQIFSIQLIHDSTNSLLITYGAGSVSSKDEEAKMNKVVDLL